MSGNSSSDSNSNGSRPTPLPVKRISVLGLILAANNTSIWMIFAFLPFMVQHYYPSLTLKELGYKAGLLGSAFSTGSLMGNFMWGVVSDRIGRRPALMYGLMGTAISSLAFGFAPSFAMAIVTRFLWGFLNGNIGVSKTYMGEILDDTNTAKGMALFGVIGGIGRTVGPILGGFLAMPADHYPGFKGTIFETYPFCLPCIVISASCVLILILSYFQLVETLIPRKKKKSKAKVENAMNQTVHGDEEHRSLTRPKHKSSYLEVNSSDDSLDSNDDSIEMVSSPSKLSLTPSLILRGKKRRLLNGLTAAKGEYGLLSDADDDVNMNIMIDQASPTNITSNDHENSFDESKSMSKSDSSSSLNNVKPIRIDKKSRRVSFAGMVMVKVIGSDLLAYGNLKKIDPMRDEPILPIHTPSSSPSSASSSASSSSSSYGYHDTYDTKNYSSKLDDGEKYEEEDQESISSDPLAYRRKANGNHFDESHGDRTNMEQRDDSHPVSPSTPALPQHIPRYNTGSVDDEEVSGLKNLWNTVIYLLSKREILISTSLYGLNAFIQLAANEIFPLWVVTSIDDGGFGYNTHAIGLATMITGPITIFTQIVIYPYLTEKLGILRVYRYGAFIFAIAMICAPGISLIEYIIPSAALSFALVTMTLAIISIGSMWVLITIFVLINNSCYSHQRGTVNGIGQTFASLGRLSGPYVGANLFAWSENNGLPWPLNYFFTWYFLGILSLVFMKLSEFLPRNIERRKREPKEPRYALGMMRGDMDDGEEDDKILLLDGEDDSVDEEYSDPSGYNGNHNHNHNKHSSASDNHQSNKKHESDLKSLEEGQMARINPISIPSS